MDWSPLHAAARAWRPGPARSFAEHRHRHHGTAVTQAPLLRPAQIRLVEQ